jgi:hypothetical protein
MYCSSQLHNTTSPTHAHTTVLNMGAYAPAPHVQAPLCKAYAPRVISDGHFAAQLSHLIPGFLSYSVAVFC